jgi:hypothetical protein
MSRNVSRNWSPAIFSNSSSHSPVFKVPTWMLHRSSNRLASCPTTLCPPRISTSNVISLTYWRTLIEKGILSTTKAYPATDQSHVSKSCAVTCGRQCDCQELIPGQYRPELKYMRQQLPMRMRRTLIYKNYLSSDVISIAFAYFLNSAHSSLKYDSQSLLIQTSQNPLQALKKLVLISQLNQFEFFFDCRKQVEATRGQIRWI